MKSISTRIATQIKFCTNKVEWSIFNPEINENYYRSYKSMPVSIGKKKGKITVPVSVSNISSEDNQLNYFDRVVHSAIVSLILAGNKCISPSMIFSVLCGNKKSSKDNKKVRVSYKNYNYIVESINKMCNTKIDIGTSEMSKDFSYSGILLPCKTVSAVLNGHQSNNCIDFDECGLPPLFKYAETLNQIETLDVDILNVDDIINNYENITLKFYLLRRILMCKRSTKMKRNIKLEVVYKLLNIDNNFSGTNLNHKRSRIINTVIKCMEFWTSKNIITSYGIKRDSNQFTNIVFSL